MRLSKLHLAILSISGLLSLQGTQLYSQEAPRGGIKATVEPDKTAAKPAEEQNDIPLSTVLMMMKPGTVVLNAGKLKATWKDIYPFVKRYLVKENKIAGKESNPEEEETLLRANLRMRFQEIAQRAILLQEAEEAGIAVTDEERAAYEKELEEGLAGNNEGLTKDDVIAAIKSNAGGYLYPSYDETLKIQKFTKEKFKNLSVTKEEIQTYIMYKGAVNRALAKNNDNTREGINSLLQRPEINTDEGFAALAKEFSDGVEASWGGELKVDFTREELADINSIKSFTWNEGENTPVIETETAFRIMRVLKVNPPQGDQKEETLHVAQILNAKIAVENLEDKETIRKMLTTKKFKRTLDAFVQSQKEKYKLSSILFPEGIWETRNKSGK